MGAADVVRNEKKRKRDKHDRGNPDVAKDVRANSSDVAAAPTVAAPPAVAATPAPAVGGDAEEGTGTKKKSKSKGKKKKQEKKMKRKMGQAQEDDGRSGTDNGAEDEASHLAAAAAARSSVTATGQRQKPAKRRKKGSLPSPPSPSPSSPSPPSSASPSVGKPLAGPAAAVHIPSVGAVPPRALLCTGKIDEYPPISGQQPEYPPISGEQAAGKGTSDGRGRSSPRGIASRTKKKKGRRSRPDSESKDDDTNDKGNHNNNSNNDDDDINSNNEIEDDPLEGVVHDGAMFLVDAKRRVFSAERDERGNLIKVGHFDDNRSEVVLETRLQATDGNTPEAGVGALGAAGKTLSKPPTSADLDTGTAAGVPQGGGIAGGGATAIDGAETEADCNGKKKKKKKKKKKSKTGTGVVGEDGAAAADGKESGSGSKLPGVGPRDVVEYPFEVEECDHCETGELAYAHIAPLLAALAAELGKSAEELVIYDPYFCQGSTARRLASLGFPRVYNKNEDFYEAVKSGTIPEYDVLVTNPPFSGEHVPKILSFCARQGAKPWLLLMPNYVYLKDYYEPSLSSGSSRGATLPFYLTPPKRYMYYSPQGSRVNVKSSERKTSPFNTFWYIRLGDGGVTSKILQAYDARSRKPGDEPKCCVARTTQQIPFKMMDSNDPRRKKARDRQRSIDRIRKKKSEWTVS